MSPSSTPENKDPKTRIEELEALLDRVAENLDRVQRKLREVGDLLDRDDSDSSRKEMNLGEKDLFSKTDLNWLSTAI